jgi:hypothetical protein
VDPEDDQRWQRQRRWAGGSWLIGSNARRGSDARMGPRDIRLFQALFALVVIVVVALAVIALRS